MDNLKSCYTTRMRLRLDPELIATVRWYWAPPGALPLPTETAFGSTVWETPDRDYPQPDLGEIDLTRTWNNGAAPMGITGTETPTPLDWYVNGVPAGVDGPFAPCNGTLPSGVGLWLRTEEITTVPQTPTFRRWPAAPGTLWHGWPGVSLPPQLGQDLTTGRYGAVLSRRIPLPNPHTLSTYLEFHKASQGNNPTPYQTLAVTGDFTVYVAYRTPYFVGDGLAFPGIGDINTQLWASTEDGSGGLLVKLSASPFDSGVSLTTPGFQTTSVRVSGTTAIVRMNGVDQASGPQTPVPWNLLRVEEAIPVSFLVQKRSLILFEIIYWPRALGAAELAAVDAYLTAKYSVPPTGGQLGHVGSGAGPSSPQSGVVPVHGSMLWTVPGTYTWTCPVGVSHVNAYCWGAGGGGGDWDGSASGGGGGGGGCGSYLGYAVTPGTNYTVVVGTGGTVSASGDGSAGGDSSFDATLFGRGGAGGIAGSASSAAGGSSAGGTASHLGGNGGQGGFSNSTASGGGGGGGASDNGSGGNGGADDTGSGGSAGAGGASSISHPGGAGGTGDDNSQDGAGGGNHPGGGGGGGGWHDTGGSAPGGNGQVFLSW